MSDHDEEADSAQSHDEEVPLEKLRDRIPTDGDDRSGANDAEDSDTGIDIAEGDESEGEPAESDTGDQLGAGAPLERITGDVRKRREQREQREQSPESDPFEEMDVGEVEGEAVWEDLLSEDEQSEDQQAVGTGVNPNEIEEVGSGVREEFIVPKKEFCSRCPNLSLPPEVVCEHDGTEIIEVADSEHFRVRGCPFTGRDEDELASLE